jgi:hypothetical protein
MEKAALVEKRNAVLNAGRRVDLAAYLKGVWADNPDKGLQSILTGSQRARRGARRSVALEQQVLENTYLGGMIADLDRGKLTEVFASGTLDQDVARALWRLDDPLPTFKDLQPEAVDVARVLRKYQELARSDANEAGAWIGREKGYIVRQSHDMYKVRNEGFEAWRASITPKLDELRMLEENPGSTLDEILAGAYQGIADGLHLKSTSSPGLAGFKGPANLAKKVSQERVLHFKSADDWFAYNQEFGTGNLREAAYSGLRRSAHATGLMRRLGTNPESMLDTLQRDILDATADPGKRRDLAEAMKASIGRRLPEVDGSINIPVSQMGARVYANLRAIESMAKLGGAFISSFSDIATHASETSFQGRGYLTGITDSLRSLAGRPEGERKQILNAIGVFSDSVRADLTRAGSFDDSISALASRAQARFFKLNLLSWWTDAQRSGAVLSLSNFLAHDTDKTISQLHPDLQRLFKQYGIDAGMWDKIRAGAQSAADGRVYLTPDGIKDRGAADALRGFLLDRAHTAVVEPDAETRAIMRRGSRPGTWAGELLRFVGQFKSFGVAFSQRVLGREIYGRGHESMGSALKDTAVLGGIAKLMLTTTALGYASMTTKDLLRGKNPRDPRSASTWQAALLQGGGLAIYGDFLLGQRSRTGGGLLGAVAGPVIGAVDTIDTLRSKAMSGDATAADLLRLGLANTPFVNLFYTRQALDYLFLNELQEQLNPGYLRRLEQRVKRENDQTFWLPPSAQRIGH